MGYSGLLKVFGDIRAVKRHTSGSFTPINIHAFSQHLLVYQRIDGAAAWAVSAAFAEGKIEHVKTNVSSMMILFS